MPVFANTFCSVSEKNFCRASPLFCFTSTISRFGKRSRVVSIHFDHFLVFFVLFTLGAPCPVICKSVGTCPRAPGGVSVTSVLQFHTLLLI